MALKYQQSAPVAAATVNAPDWCEVLSLNPAGTLATLTVGMPKQPKDGQQFILNSTQIVTALTLQVQASSNQTLLAAATSLAVGVSRSYIFNAPSQTWMPA